jgi:retron-type reverse transcriptase
LEDEMSYNGLRGREGPKQPADARARQVPTDAHEGSYRDYLRRHERESVIATRGSQAQRNALDNVLLERVADSRTLRLAIDYLASDGGSAPGPNDQRLDELDGTARWELARSLGKSIRTGCYRPGPVRQIKIPKGPGRGYRTISLANIQDRVVERAIVSIVQPILDPRFAATSFGYRPKRGREDALATAEVLAATSGCWVWVAEDVKNAFDQVPHGRLIDIVRGHLPAADIQNLIENVIKNKKGRGLRQGGNLSPLLLNLYMDHFLDRPWARQHGATPLLRVADDLLVLAHDLEQAQQARQALEERLRPAGLPLKGTPQTTIHDLASGATVTWLGFDVSRSNQRLVVRLTEKNWDRLAEHLELAHTKPQSPIRAYETIVGWVGQLGPCALEQDLDEVHARIADLARTSGFEEFPTREDTHAYWRQAQTRWERTRRDVRDTLRVVGMTTAPPVSEKISAKLG